MKVKAWYFSDESRKLRYGDGRNIAIGVEHTVKGYPNPCTHGLHGSERIRDALKYAPGPIVWQVELSGRIKKADDKIAATRRKYIAGGIDISDTLWLFARKQALSVIDKWDCPVIVRQWLETGDESIRSAAESAAGSAAESAAWSTGKSAAWAAARSAAESAARYAADAAESAARYAAWSTAGSAAWYATESTARSAVEYAAWSAVRYVARSAAKSAAWSAARSAANEMLEKMVLEVM